MQALRAMAEAELTTPTDLVRGWVHDQLQRLPDLYADNQPLAEDPADPRERLRQAYRPEDVPLLFVGESAPAGGTFFYQADSNLFSAIHEACVRAFGDL